MDFDSQYVDLYDDDSALYEEALDDNLYLNDNSPLQEGVSFSEMLEHCAEPTMASGLKQVILPLAMSILLRVSTRLIPMPILFCHYCSMVCGLACFIHMLGPNAIFTVIAGGSTYWLTNLSARKPCNNTFVIIMYLSLIYLVIREYTGHRVITESWEQVRGIQMIIYLKTISLTYDVVHLYYTGDAIPLRVEHLGYIFCPATFIFGPWVSYATYLSMFDRNKPMLRGFVKQVPRLLFLAFFSLAFSSCGVYWLFLGFNSRWFIMVRDAMSVRFSHYFISFLSEAMCAIVGFSTDIDKSRVKVVDVLKIEFPRSLSEVVVNWNKPMHFWLKRHAYYPAAYLGATKTVLLTFLISAMLHGLNFQLSCVLLSLGIYCFVEYSLRDKLASIFNACIKSRRCPSNCKHEHKAGNPLVMLTNFLLSCVAYFHLSYLGVMMDTNNVGDKPVGLIAIIIDRLGRWNSLGFSSHWLVVFTALAMYVI